MSRTLGLAVAALAAAGAALCATSALAAKDKFNRATLGEKWVLVKPGPGYGDLVIDNNQLHNAGAYWGCGFFKKSKNDNSVTATFIVNGTDDQGGGIIVGKLHDGDNADNAFVEIGGSNDTGTSFDHAGFFTGQDGNGPGTGSFLLSSPVPSPVKMTVTVCGTVAKMTIKSAAPTQIYTFDYGVVHGVGGGLATFKTIIDNYKSEAVSCSGFSEGSIVIRASKAKD